jgi:chemotaxis response regulator CheB
VITKDGFTRRDGKLDLSGGPGTRYQGKNDRPDDKAAVEKRTVTRTAGFPIVGLGASAGGVEALVEFFNQMRPDAGIGLASSQP